MRKYKCNNGCFDNEPSEGYDVDAKVIQRIEIKVDEFGELLGVYDERRDETVPLDGVDEFEIEDTPTCGGCGEPAEEILEPKSWSQEFAENQSKRTPLNSDEMDSVIHDLLASKDYQSDMERAQFLAGMKLGILTMECAPMARDEVVELLDKIFVLQRKYDPKARTYNPDWNKDETKPV